MSSAVSPSTSVVIPPSPALPEASSLLSARADMISEGRGDQMREQIVDSGNVVHNETSTTGEVGQELASIVHDA